MHNHSISNLLSTALLSFTAAFGKRVLVHSVG